SNGLASQSKHLAQHGVIGIAAAHARNEAPRHAQRETMRRLRCELIGQSIQAQRRKEFSRVGDGLAPLALPATTLGAARRCSYHFTDLPGPPALITDRKRESLAAFASR